MNILAVILAATAPMATRQAATNIAEHVVAEATPGIVAAAVAAVPAPDYSTANTQLVATIEATAPAPGNYAAVSNAAMTALHTETDPTVHEWAKGETPPLPPNYATVSNRAMSALQEHQPLTNYYTKSQVNASLSAKANDNAVVKLTGNQMIGGEKTFTNEVYVSSGIKVKYNYTDRDFTIGDLDESQYGMFGITGIMDTGRWGFRLDKVGDMTLISLPSASGTLALESTVAAAAVAATNYTDEAIGDISFPVRSVNQKTGAVVLSAADVGAYPSADGQALAGIVNTWEGYWGGTNVIFEVTNYYGNTSGEIPRLRVKEFRDETWHTVWDEASKFQVCETNIMSNVVGYVTGEISDLRQYAADNFAPMAWGMVTDKGSPNPVSNTVWMTSPETYFAGGTEYQRVAVGSGEICVLVDNGALTKTAGEPGTFRFQDDGGTNYFGFAKSDSYTIGCRTDGITVSGTLVTLRYDVIMAGTDVPIVYWRLSLESGEWVQLNNSDGTATPDAPYTVTWYTSGGSYYAAINCGANASGFFKAETEIAGEVVFETNMKIRADGGLECPNTSTGENGVIRPTFNGSTVIWNWSKK